MQNEECPASSLKNTIHSFHWSVTHSTTGCSTMLSAHFRLVRRILEPLPLLSWYPLFPSSTVYPLPQLYDYSSRNDCKGFDLSLLWPVGKLRRLGRGCDSWCNCKDWTNAVVWANWTGELCVAVEAQIDDVAFYVCVESCTKIYSYLLVT